MNYTKLRRTAGLIIVLLTTWGCALLNPPNVIIPTPIPTAPPLNQTLIGNTEVVVDPVSNITPNIDPDIETLVNAVSKQQLIAYVQTLESFGTRNSFSDTERVDWGIGASRRWIYDEFVRVGQSSNGRMEVRYDDFPLTFAGFSAPQQNVIAILPGTTAPTDVIVLMAHYDTRPGNAADGTSRAPGANDNAAGVALLLESARLLSARPWNQTIIFLATSAEEQGTFGAQNFVQNAVFNNLNVVAAINYDGVGGNYGIPQSIRLFAPDSNQSPSGELGRYYNYIGGLYFPAFPVAVENAMDREERWGDHREFVFAGMPAVRLTQSYEDPIYINSTRDTWSEIDFDYLAQVTKLNVAVTANMAGGPPRPQPPLITTMAGVDTYLLTWEVSPLAAGYIMSFRPLDLPIYPLFRFVSIHEAGNVALTGINPNQRYGVSIAGITATGRLGPFSPEVMWGGE